MTSAKRQQDVRIRKTSAKATKEKIFNYENHIGGVDFTSVNEQSKITDNRPLSGLSSNLLNKRSFQNFAVEKSKNPSSLIDEFNKKLVEKGTSYPVHPSELPQVSQYL